MHGQRCGGRVRVGVVALACLCVLVAAGAATAATVERPANELTKYVAGLRTAARLAEQARTSAAGLSGRQCATFAPAAARLIEAANASRTAFDAYRKANTRYGTQEEIELITSVAVDLRVGRALLGRAAGESGVASAAEQAAAEREVGLFQAVVAQKIEDRLRIEGLGDVLRSTSFAEMKNKVVAELQTRLRTRAESELRRLTGLRIRLDVPLREQIRDVLENELSRAISRLGISAGPAGIVISLLGARLVELVGARLEEALRHKGSLPERTTRTVAGFAALQAELRKLPSDATLDRVRAVVRDSQRALGATRFLEGDLRRAGRTDLLTQLSTAREKLKRTLSVARYRFLLDSALVGEDFRIGIDYAARVRADAERLAKKAGCTLPSSGGPSDEGKAASASACPALSTMESIQSLPPYAVSGTFPVRFSRFEKTDDHGAKCLYVTENGNEAFVIFISWVPPDLPGRIASGDCSRTRPDSPPVYNSRKRYLGVSGGERGMFTRALGGNGKVLLQALALAEAQGVGRACPAK
jgi:hypothetical protein